MVSKLSGLKQTSHEYSNSKKGAKTNSHSTNASHQSHQQSSQQSQSQPQQSSQQHSQSQSQQSQSNHNQFKSNNSTRRVWVKKVNGTPTTLIINQDYIVDDLKQDIMYKFPNSLAKIYDPADLRIILVRNNQNRINLEPDQSVWTILDQYFPGGMTKNNAFLIEEPIPEVNEPHSNVSRGSIGSLSSPYDSVPQQQNSTQLYHTAMSQQHYPHGKIQNTTRSTTPTYYQPKPQYSHSPSKSIAHIPDRSVSPANVTPGILHRRAHSNPSRSPSIDSNSQAVLLLPKNFSLNPANGGLSQGKKNSISGRNRDSTSPEQTFPHKSDSIGQRESAKDNSIDAKVNTDSFNISQQPAGEMKRKVSDSKREEDKNSNNSNNNGSVSKINNGNSNNSGHIASSTTTNNNNNNNNNGNVNGNNNNNNNNNSNNNNNNNNNNNANNKLTRSIKGPKSATDRVLPSISVLVVEDNAINQAILGAFLRRHKIHYQIAKNGQEAIDKWRKGGFHLVLMDIQLPVKSGIEATKEIRHLEKINKIGVFAESESAIVGSSQEITDSERLDMDSFRSPVIIVALTASSNSSVDRKNALMAGCNDYLTKPVNLVWLQNKITEWGCMQALIDFDGWKTEKLLKSTESHDSILKPTKPNDIMSLTSSQKSVITL
ncbi:uncharacterized protein RJT21DRAFT_84983 [Scheffersomyces amazonensis]|uniref:uncharacterized protein n=1 Tax=Scheffersomyces amazonensis TaxID=1078765 RepID=UPI00315D866A